MCLFRLLLRYKDTRDQVRRRLRCFDHSIRISVAAVNRIATTLFHDKFIVHLRVYLLQGRLSLFPSDQTINPSNIRRGKKKQSKEERRLGRVRKNIPMTGCRKIQFGIGT